MSLSRLEVLFTPADFGALDQRDLQSTVCVVFDVLRATSSMVTALSNGAEAVIPVAEIEQALKIRLDRPEVLLAGERDGLRIGSELTGGVPFDLGNSPREFTREKVQGRTLVTTTTNGTRALRACAGALEVFIGSLLNLGATAAAIEKRSPDKLLVVCSGTFEEAAYEDVLAAGALCDLIWPTPSDSGIADSAQMARLLFNLEKEDLAAAIARSRNGRRLLTRPELSGDVEFCAQRDAQPIVATLSQSGEVRRCP